MKRPLTLDDQQTFVVDQVDGALLLISTTDFEELNGFDERFELYYDDVDLCVRAMTLGGVRVLDDAWGLHVGGESSRSVSEMAYCVLTISRIRYFLKHFESRSFVRIYLLALGCIEFVARSVTRCPEGQGARLEALRLQRLELGSPGSIKVLS